MILFKLMSRTDIKTILPFYNEINTIVNILQYLNYTNQSIDFIDFNLRYDITDKID